MKRVARLVNYFATFYGLTKETNTNIIKDK